MKEGFPQRLLVSNGKQMQPVIRQLNMSQQSHSWEYTPEKLAHRCPYWNLLEGVHLSIVCSGRELEATCGLVVKDTTLSGVINAFSGKLSSPQN